jgi:DNA/RNA-binding domain of Phe-tRNA-synthetase-like protein
MIEISERLKKVYPGAVVGVLAMQGAKNPARHGELENIGAAVETRLRNTFAAGGKPALKAHPVIAAYERYYKAFKKSYHVTLQLDSVIWKGRGVPSVSAVVKAMFIAELSNMLLTAGHDLEKVRLPLRLDVGGGTEMYAALGEEQRIVKEGDMFISDAAGVISSVIGGPDQRTSISADTKDLLFTVYAPPGIGEPIVRRHLEDIQRYVTTIAPDAATHCAETLVAE